MLLLPLIACCLVIIFVKIWKTKNDKYRHFGGPSPFLSLPYFGHALLLKPNPVKELSKWHRLEGDMFRFDIGNVPTVFLCSHKLVSEAFKTEEFNGRNAPHNVIAETFRKGNCFLNHAV